MMRLYLDSNIPKSVFRVISSLEEARFPQKYEVVRGKWSDEYTTEDTIVFLINLNSKGFDPTITSHLEDGYKVVAYRKPLNEGINAYECALTFMEYWKKILSDIDQHNDAVLISFRNKGKYQIVKM